MSDVKLVYRTFSADFLGKWGELTITSLFGMRFHTVHKENRFHTGIDLRAAEGTTLRAPLDGTIISAKVIGSAGLTITLKHNALNGDVLFILFMHMHTVDPKLKLGYEVKEGDFLGTTGGSPSDGKNAGTSSGPHLHLEVRRGSNDGANAIDPMVFLIRNDLKLKATGKIIRKASNVYQAEVMLSEVSRSGYKGGDLQAGNITVWNESELGSPKRKAVQNTIAKERLAPGVWQIIKLVVDSSVEDKQVLDSGISTQQGSLLNYFRKVCQEPLVELMGDTFGNQYYWIVRRPPFDKEGLTKMIDLTMLTLNDNDIITTDLTWNNDNIYSWYRYIPRGDLLGIQEANLFMPAVFFPEIASVWGSRPLCIESNYFNFEFSGRFNSEKKENKTNGDNIIRAAVNDFKFMVESTIYSPFTRRGVITLKGDRRIKRGTVVLHTSGELFYVDSVSNSFEVTNNGVNRITTLAVSRGMFPEFIYGKKIGEKMFSYFNIVDFGEEYKDVKIDSTNWQKYISKWKINLDNFNFFMSKQQIYHQNINKPLL